jgi:hypothetical protein
VQRLWDKGRLLAGLAGGDEPFPLRLVLQRPSSAELSERFDEVRAWSRGLQANALRALVLADHWSRLLDIVQWLQAHPRPGVHLRQVDLPGVRSKYIEEHAAVLSELFDLVLPADAIDGSVTGAANLARRYGFRAKPVRVRFRLRDPQRSLLGTGMAEDVTVDHGTFARLAPAVSRVFITENEVNFLAFPPVADAPPGGCSSGRSTAGATSTRADSRSWISCAGTSRMSSRS